MKPFGFSILTWCDIRTIVPKPHTHCMHKSVNHPAYTALIDSLIRARKAKGLTIRQLAELLDEDHTFVSKVETRVRKLSVLEFVQYARALGVDPADLINRLERQVKRKSDVLDGSV